MRVLSALRVRVQANKRSQGQMSGQKQCRPGQSVRASAASSDIKEVVLQAEPLTREAFAPFGQVIEPIDDMKDFDENDAQLNLSNGTPRFYIMRSPAKPEGLSFAVITYHKDVTQCLGAQTPAPWYMALVRPGIENPKPDDLKVFKVPFGVFIKMNQGTWHAGPLFEGHDYMDFYNLELADTNRVDHTNYHFDKRDGVQIRISKCE